MKTTYTRSMRAVDLFCGAGGSSWGARSVGVEIVAGFDMWRLAGRVFQDNFPEARFFKRKLEYVNPIDFVDRLGRIDLLLASPECTNHSPARGNKPKSEESQNTAYQVIRFARVLRPRWIIIENVVSMKRWDRYSTFLERLNNLGYKVQQQILDSANFGVPQSRRRLFIICGLGLMPNPVSPPSVITKKLAKDILSSNGEYPLSPLVTPNRASRTLERANRAIEALKPKNSQFLLVYYGTDGAGGWQKLSRTLRTVTTVDRFALIKPTKDGYMMRMLQVPELQAAMGFPVSFRIDHGTRREKIHMLGNAVCPPVIAAIVSSIATQEKQEFRTVRKSNKVGTVGLVKPGSLDDVLTFRQRLIQWGRNNYRAFPWRLSHNPYHLLVAEVMLHRTQAAQVRPIYEKFITLYPDCTALSRASLRELRTILYPLGLNWRIDLMHRMSLDLVNRFGGDIPRDSSDLLSLPGVSDYVAAAVRCFSWNLPDPLIDSNTVRITGRLFGLEIKQSSRRNSQFRALIRYLVDPADPRSYNYALLDLAESVCTLRKPPECRRCPILEWCKWGRDQTL